jgi:FG-GAP-like repeat
MGRGRSENQEAAAVRTPHIHRRGTSIQRVAVRAGIVAIGCLLAVSTAGAAGDAVVDPSFVPGAAFDAGLSPAAAAVADFNRDQAPDLAVASCLDWQDVAGNQQSRSEVKILLGDGSGGFRAGPPPLRAGARTCSLASADVNHEGAPDLAVAVSSGSAVAILLGDGTGNFAAAPGSPVHLSGTPTSIVAADLTGDGRPDLVVPVANSSGRITGIEILLGDGSGGFAEAPGSPVSILAGSSISVAVADFNGDGKADLAVANTQRNEISLLRGDGIGGFGSPVSVASGRRLADIAVGDFDGNGKPDLAALVTNRVAILLGDGTGNFHAPGSPLPGYADDLAVADLNGDGKSDIATSSAEDGAVSVEVATGAGAVRRAAFSPFAALTDRLAVGDFNGDGRPDLAALGGEAGAVGGPVSVVLQQTESAPQAHAGRALRGRDAVFSTRKPITALAADRNHAAICTGGVPVGWAPGRAPVTFKTGPYGGCSFDLAVGGGHVAWTEVVGFGNLELDIGVFVSKLQGGRRKEVDEEVNDCGAGPCYPTGTWVEQLLGGGPLIAWSDSTVACVANCDEGEDAFASYRVTRQALVRYSAGHARRVRRDSADHTLLAVGGGRMALQVGGRVVVLKPNGARIAGVDAPDVQSVALSRTELGIAGRSALNLYDPARGHLRKTIALGPNAALQLAGITSRLALLRAPHALVLVRLGDGALISFPLASKAAKRLVHAKLTAVGLFYAFNVTRGKAKGRIVFEPTSRLLARF